MKSRSNKKAGSTADNDQRRRGCPFFVRLFAATLTLTVLQFGTFLTMLFVSGEFSYIKNTPTILFPKRPKTARTTLKILWQTKCRWYTRRAGR